MMSPRRRGRGEVARNSERAFVTGGPGARMLDKQRQKEIGIVSTAMNTGKAPAFTKKVFWGVCKESEWETVGRDWPQIEEAQQQDWEDVLPPQMAPGDRYPIACTATEIPDDGESRVCYGTIIYRDVFGHESSTSWKHLVVRKGQALSTDALPGGYSREWDTDKQRR